MSISIESYRDVLLNSTLFSKYTKEVHVILALDRTFIEMTAGSHLPAHQSDNKKDILHETQMLLVNMNDQRSDRIDNLEIVAYISGKKSLFRVSI